MHLRTQVLDPPLRVQNCYRV